MSWGEQFEEFWQLDPSINQHCNEDIKHFYQLHFASATLKSVLPHSWHQTTRHLWPLTSIPGPRGTLQEAEVLKSLSSTFY